jgi:hypothetical protein
MSLLSTFVSLLTAASVFALGEWPIPIPESLLPVQKDQHLFVMTKDQDRPEHVRLIQTVEGQYQWTGDLENLLREGVRLMDVRSIVGCFYPL